MEKWKLSFWVILGLCKVDSTQKGIVRSSWLLAGGCCNRIAGIVNLRFRVLGVMVGVILG